MVRNDAVGEPDGRRPPKNPADPNDLADALDQVAEDILRLADKLPEAAVREGLA